MAQESLYLDTSVPSAYYDERVMWRLDYTRQWWRKELPKYEVFIYAVVVAEMRRTEAPKNRNNLLELVKGLNELEITSDIEDIAEGYINQKVIPQKYFLDALHIALASFYKIDFLITWNCEHLAEAHRRKRIRLYNTSAGLFVPELVTPMELLEGGE